MSEELKPCPFCGGKAYIGEPCICTSNDSNEWMVHVGCNSSQGYCAIRPKVLLPKEMAIKAWNGRVK